MECVIREVQEETGLIILNPKLNGYIDFYFGEKPKPDWSTYVYIVTEYKGKLKSSDEGKFWFNEKGTKLIRHELEIL